MLLAHLCILALSIYAIVRSSDSLVDIASGLGAKARLNDYFIGSFLVGIGTSLPELFTSVAAADSGSPELVAPTVFGTVIANIGAGFGLGVLALFFFVRTKENQFRLITKSHALSSGELDFGSVNAIPVIFAALSVVLTLFLCRLDGVFGRFDASLFLILYAVFIYTEFRRSRQQAPPADPHPIRPEIRLSGSDKRRQMKAVRQIAFPLLIFCILLVPGVRPELSIIAAGDVPFWFFIGGLVLLFGFECWDYGPELAKKGGSEATNVANVPALAGVVLLGFIIGVLYFSGVIVVGALVKIAEDLQINSGALAASALAIGTSLPDIVVALNVTRRGRHKLLVGHIFQSNVFDAFLIMGICGLMIPLPEVATGSANISIIAAVLLTLPLLWTLRSRRLTLPGGLGLFLCFLFFIWRLYW